jgi:hypothetical protein
LQKAAMPKVSLPNSIGSAAGGENKLFSVLRVIDVVVRQCNFL